MSDATTKHTNGTVQIRFGGIGGQGIVLTGRLVGKAAALFDGKEAVCTQAYGPEARGGASRSDVIVSDNPIDYPFVTEADVLAVLFQEAYTRYRSMLRPGGTLLVDTGLVQPREDEQTVYGIPATSIAEDLGARLMANIVMLGYLVGTTGVVSREALERAIRTTVRERFTELGVKALHAGISRADGDSTS